MNINQHNYEEFFLLYADNELTTEQRKIVEAFVASNPDLKDDFELIQQSTFSSNEMLNSEFKQSLLKPVEHATGITEEQLLLYVDNELSTRKKMTIEKLIAANNSLQKEIHLLQQTKQEADYAIVFPDKNVLYKKTHPANLFFISEFTRRWAAAAAILILLATVIWLLPRQLKMKDAPLAKNPSLIQEKKNVPLQNIPQTAEIKQQQNAFHKTDDIQTAAPYVNNKPKINSHKEQSKTAINNPATTQQLTAVQQPIKQETMIAKNETQVTAVPENNSTQKSNFYTTPAVPQVTNTATTYSYASYNHDENAEDETVFLNEERQRRSGLKGWVKKARRMIERKTGIQSTEPEVRFAVFAINTQ